MQNFNIANKVKKKIQSILFNQIFRSEKTLQPLIYLYTMKVSYL